MFHELVSHNDDIQRLVERGYAVAFDDHGYLIVRDIPYLDQDLQSQCGAIVTKFVDTGQDRIIQDDHQVFFAGGVPHGLDGKPIPNLGGGPANLAMSNISSDVVVQRSFSNKPQSNGKFKDFFHKIESYVTIISGPAITKRDVTPLTFRTIETGQSESPFKIRDTLTSRAEIGDLSAKFNDDMVAVIGIGGTGAYVLDFLAKTPVREIRGFDADIFHVHNAFRSPGRLELSEFGKPKAEVYQERYQNLREDLTVRCEFIDATSVEDLDGVTFAFVCVDKGSSRVGIFDLLTANNIPFIDVGMGLARTSQGALGGMLRTTYYSKENAASMRKMGLAEFADDPEGLYRTNIQIGELNALNASLAVIMFKQIRGFYDNEGSYCHLLFRVANMKAIRNAETAQD